MKQIRATTPQFQGFASFASYAAQEQLKLRDADAPEKYAAHLQRSIEKNIADEKFLYGQRTEAMFEAMVAELGEVALLKQEDGVNCFAKDESLEVPDFRIVLQGGRQLLVEVKNYHQKDPTKGLEQKTAYIEGLEAYARLTNSELKIAVFWSRWRIWTLASSSLFKRNGERAELSMHDAMMHNEMSVLGDLMLGTRGPLRIVMRVHDAGSTRVGSESTHDLRTEAIDMYSEDRLLTGGVERKLAWYLMVFGGWIESAPVPELVDGRLVSITYEFNPDPDQQEPNQGFNMVGYLSQMFSTYFLRATAEEEAKGVRVLNAKISPGSLGRLVPDGYKSEELPLWIFRMQTKGTDPALIDDLRQSSPSTS